MAIFEVLNNQQSYFNRYFRRNVGDDDYATHSSVTVDRIVMDVNPSAGNGNTGLPTGAPAVTDNIMQTIDFAYSGTISELYRNGSDYFKGVVANVKYYLSGELIHSWSINSNSSTESDSVGGLVLTIINGNASDWGLFDRQASGDWLGQELVVNGGFDTNGGWVADASWSISEGVASCDGSQGGNTFLRQYDILSAGLKYVFNYSVSAYFSGQVVLAGVGSFTTAPVSSVGNYTEIVTNTSASQLAARGDGSFIGSIDNVSVKEVLKNA